MNNQPHDPAAASRGRTGRAAPTTPLSEVAAAEAMWTHYRDHKASLVGDVKEHREQILFQLRSGRHVAEVFAPFRKQT